MANVLGTMIVQDLTYTQAKHGINFTVTYVNGGVAGQEVVTLGDTDIIVKIASGTSTATQIRAAILAKPQALALVSVAISGTGSNAQKSAVRAFLSGGVSSVKAAAPVALHMQLEARTAGTGGNSITYKFADTGTFSIGVVGNDITINVDDTVTSFKQVFDGLKASSAASNLVNVLSPNDMSQFTVDIVGQSLPLIATSLAGGSAATNQAVVIQDLTYTSTTAGPSNKRQSVTYTIGAVAGSEVVTLDANGNETIQISNGVSTATQIKAAHDASAPALALRTVAITGVGSTAQRTVNELATIASEATPSTKDYFANQATVALTTSYVAQPFGFHAESIVIYNDEVSPGTDYVEWSFNGTDTGGRLYAGESIVLDHLGDGRAVISLRSVNAGADYRLEVAESNMSAIFSNEVLADVQGDVTVVQPTGTNLHVVTDATSVTTVDNAAGAAAVNIQDGGNSITVDGNTNPNGLTDAQLRASPVPVSGSLTITPITAATADITRVTVSTTVATLKAANAARLSLIVHNESGILFVKLGAAATSTDYTFRLTANTLLEIDEYTGIVTAIKSAGTSEAQVTEL